MTTSSRKPSLKLPPRLMAALAPWAVTAHALLFTPTIPSPHLDLPEADRWPPGWPPAQHTAPPARALTRPGPTHLPGFCVGAGPHRPGCLRLTWARSSQRLPPWLGPRRAGMKEAPVGCTSTRVCPCTRTHVPRSVSSRATTLPAPAHLPALGTTAESPALCGVFPPPLGQPLVPADLGSAAHHPPHRSHPVITGQRVPGETDNRHNEETVADARFPKSRGLAGGWSSLLTSRRGGITT